MALGGADHQQFPGCLYHLFGEGAQFVDRHDPSDLAEQALQQPKVAAGDANDGGDGFGIGEVAEVDHQTQFLPLVLEDEVHFLFAQRLEVMDEADPGVELRIARQTLFG